MRADLEMCRVGGGLESEGALHAKEFFDCLEALEAQEEIQLQILWFQFNLLPL